MLQNSSSKKSYERIPIYLDYLNKIKQEYVSSKLIASETNFTEISVRKDLASFSNGGKPKLGFKRTKLIRDIKKHMRYNQMNEVVLVGFGRLGKALYKYNGFTEYGAEIVQAFDVVETKQVLDVANLKSYCLEHEIKFAALTVPKEVAQDMADILVSSGIKGIWNFTSIRINVPTNVIVQNVNLATSLSILIKETMDSLV